MIQQRIKMHQVYVFKIVQMCASVQKSALQVKYDSNEVGSNEPWIQMIQAVGSPQISMTGLTLKAASEFFLYVAIQVCPNSEGPTMTIIKQPR